jgi:hypothetical protein
LCPIDDPRELARRLDQQPGLIGHGLFPPEMVDLVIVGIRGDNVDVRRPANSRNGSSHPDSGNVGRLGRSASTNNATRGRRRLGGRSDAPT